jgi:type I restriction-modification system DNA methylase subunit
MEHTRGEMRDVLGDLFQGAITYGENQQVLTPEPVARLMARLATGEFVLEEGRRPTVCDPCCGSGRMLLAVAELHGDWEFFGQDIDLRCVRMTALNLAFRNL